MWEIIGKISEEIFLLGPIEYSLIVYSDHYNGSPQSSHYIETPHRHTGKKEDSKISIERLLTSTLNALYLLLWPHLCGVDL